MEDVLSERMVVHGSSRLARIVIIAGLVIGHAAIVLGEERPAGFVQPDSGVDLLAPQTVAPGDAGQRRTRQVEAILVAPAAQGPVAGIIEGRGRPAAENRAVDVTASFTPQRLVEQAAQHLDDAQLSLRRQATYSAKASVIESLRLIAEARDYARREATASAQLSDGLAAIDESNDFIGRYGPLDPAGMRRVIESHATDTLKNVDPTTLSCAAAADCYLDTARERLAAVALGNPIATRALVILAEIHRQEKTMGPHADAVAVNLLRAALQSAPADSAVANELGFLLMKQGILDEAQWALERSMAIAPTRSAAQNLAEVMRQRGNSQGARALLASLNDPRNFPAAPAQRPNAPAVQMLAPSEFAALSRPQQAFARPASGSGGGLPQASAPYQAVRAHEALPAVESPPQQKEPATGPVGRVAKAFSAWFQ